MNTVISRASADTRFTTYHEAKAPMEALRVKAHVLVRGRANTTTAAGVIIPVGVTHVSDEAAAFLQDHPTFKDMVASGYMEIVKGEKSDAEANKLADKHLQARDPSSPLTHEKLAELARVASLKVANQDYGTLVLH